jgi:hypothetical protein
MGAALGILVILQVFLVDEMSEKHHIIPVWFCWSSSAIYGVMHLRDRTCRMVASPDTVLVIFRPRLVGRVIDGSRRHLLHCSANKIARPGLRQRPHEAVIKLHTARERFLPHAFVFAMGASIIAFDCVAGYSVCWHSRRIGENAI